MKQDVVLIFPLRCRRILSSLAVTDLAFKFLILVHHRFFLFFCIKFAFSNYCTKVVFILLFEVCLFFQALLKFAPECLLRAPRWCHWPCPCPARSHLGLPGSQRLEGRERRVWGLEVARSLPFSTSRLARLSSLPQDLNG